MSNQGLITLTFHRADSGNSELRQRFQKYIEDLKQELFRKELVRKEPEKLAEKALKGAWELVLSEQDKRVGERNFVPKSVSSVRDRNRLDIGKIDIDDNKLDFGKIDIKEFKSTKTTLYRFCQEYSNLPVYGALSTVELDDQQSIVAINSSMVRSIPVSSKPYLEPEDIGVILKEKGEIKLEKVEINPSLYYYFDPNDEKWRLVYITNISLTDGFNPLDLVDYIIDAHNEEIVDRLPRARTLVSVT